MSRTKEIVVVTGGSGFLGQHIVCSLLDQTHFPIKEIRVFDLKPIRWFSGLKPKNKTIPVWFCKGDIRNVDDINEAFQGATVVIHNAAMIDVTTSPDVAKMNRINIQGTSDVIQSCINNNIPILIYTSIIDALHKGLMGAYGESKRLAEQLVLQADKSNLPSGKRMTTCVLRPARMYGEGDQFTLESVKAVKAKNRPFVGIGDESADYQMAYAGNIAHGFVLAINRLLCVDESDQPISPAGKAINLSDDTPVQSYNKQLQPYIESVGGKMSPYYIPFFIFKTLATLCEIFVWLMRPIYRFRFLLTRDIAWYIQYSPIHSDSDAKRYLGYKPIFSYVTALKRSVDYVKENI